jgi:hypothetical protein
LRVLTTVTLSLLLVMALSPAPVVAEGDAPSDAVPNTTDHGISESAFRALWSLDSDAVNTSVLNQSTGRAALARGTDIPFDRPPAAVERWNRGDHREFPDTNDSVSIHPPDATLSNGTVLRDVYVELFAVQPSTRAKLSQNRSRHYVAPNGSVFATVDYRVARAAGEAEPAEWTSEVESVRQLVDGTEVATTDGSHTPRLSYEDLQRFPGTNHTLTVEATVVAGPSGAVPTDRVTVRDSTTITVYDIAVSGFRGRYPDADTGLVLYKSQPWLGYRFPGGDVRGVWRFYTARDADWDRLVYSNASGTRNASSPTQPLRVYAYPIETGPTPTPRDDVTILETFGDRTQPPTLPARVHLDVLAESYTASYGLAARIDANASGRPFRLESIRALGLVRGVTATPKPRAIRETPISEANLTLTVLNRSARTLTVRARLLDAADGSPIDTSERTGQLVVGQRRVNTSANGTATVTIQRQGGSVAGRYAPGPWWRARHAYVGASDVVYVDGTIIHVLDLVYNLAVPVSLFLGAGFLIDRLTGWSLWPPWRGL